MPQQASPHEPIKIPKEEIMSLAQLLLPALMQYFEKSSCHDNDHQGERPL